MLTRRDWLTAAASASGTLLTGGLAVIASRRAAAATAARKRPNVLLIMADDATCTDLPLYGGENVPTPHIDRLARQGLTFNRAYLAEAMCQPCRAELFTGLYPFRNGCCWNHSACRPGTRSIVHHLGERGYRVGIAGKVHVKPRDAFPFEMVGGVERGCTSKTARFDPGPLRAFMAGEGPFCLVVAITLPHMPWSVGDAGRFPKKDLRLPAYLVDTPEMRNAFADYLAEVAAMDEQVGGTLAALQETGREDDTLVLFTSEQGAQLPGCKWTNYDTGVRTALVARWPGRIRPGRRTDALVQYADVLPTLVEAAGGKPAGGHFDGTSFLPVLLGRADTHREYAYHMHNNVPEGPPYPVRSVRDGRYHYIRNLTPQATFIEKHLMSQNHGRRYWTSWMRAAFDKPHAYRMIHRYMNRPAEELFDTREDPDELANLLDRRGAPRDGLARPEDIAAVKARLSAELDRWMADQNDPGVALDTVEALTASRRAARK
jgi:uncharacterized sulfatase